MQAEQEKAQKALDAFGFNAQMVQDQSNAARAINRVWSDVDLAWNDLLTTAEKPITTQLEKLDKWIKENPDAFKALMILGGGVTAAGGARVVGGILGRNLLGFGAPAKALTGSAAALTGSARALDAAAAKLAAGGGPGGGASKVAEAAVDGGGLLGWLSRGGPLQWFGKAGATGITWLGGLSAASLLEGLESGNKGIQDTLRRAHPEWTDQQMKDWVKTVQAGNNPDEAQPPPAPEQLHDRPPPTPAPDHFIDDLRSAPDLESSAITPVQALPPNAGFGTRAQREGVPEPAPSWSMFKPWTWFGKDKPTPNATPEEAEVGGSGFRIPGTDQSIGFGDQTVTLKTGGTVVQSGNPLPVRIEKIDPTAGGIGGDGGMGVGGGFGSGGVGGPGRRPTGSDAGGAAGYPGKINMPETGGRAGRGGSAGFGLYASDVGLAANKSLPPEVRAFLDTIGTGETPRGSYSNPDYDPGGLGGRYQFLKSTWVKWARKIGVDPQNFTPENQDSAAYKYADTIVRQKTGKSLLELLKSGDEGVRAAIAAVSPGVWNAITNIDRDKRGHSGAIRLFNKKLHDEQPSAVAGAGDGNARRYLNEGDHSAHPALWGKSDPINPTFIPTWQKGLLREGIFSPLPTPPHTPTPSAATSWLFDENAKENAQRWMASNWGGDTVHHHYDNSDNSMTYHDNRKTNVTVTGASEPHEIARAVGSTLDMAFSPSQAKQRFLQGAIS